MVRSPPAAWASALKQAQAEAGLLAGLGGVERVERLLGRGRESAAVVVHGEPQLVGGLVDEQGDVHLRGAGPDGVLEDLEQIEGEVMHGPRSSVALRRDASASSAKVGSRPAAARCRPRRSPPGSGCRSEPGDRQPEGRELLQARRVAGRVLATPPRRRSPASGGKKPSCENTLNALRSTWAATASPPAAWMSSTVSLRSSGVAPARVAVSEPISAAVGRQQRLLAEEGVVLGVGVGQQRAHLAAAPARRRPRRGTGPPRALPPRLVISMPARTVSRASDVLGGLLARPGTLPAVLWSQTAIMSSPASMRRGHDGRAASSPPTPQGDRAVWMCRSAR